MESEPRPESRGISGGGTLMGLCACAVSQSLRGVQFYATMFFLSHSRWKKCFHSMLLLAFVAGLKKIRNDFEKLKLRVLQAFCECFYYLSPSNFGRSEQDDDSSIQARIGLRDSARPGWFCSAPERTSFLRMIGS